MTDEEIRQSVIHLLRAYFDKSTDVDPLDDTRDLNVAGAHINALVDIILYTSNPILYYRLEETTHAIAVILLPNSTLRFKLPEPLVSMIAYRHSRTNIMDNEIIQIAADIVYSAKKNQEFWEKKRDGLIQWGRCPLQDTDTYNRYRNNVGPFGFEGWIPVIIEHQDIWIRRNQFNMYDWGLADRDQIIRPDSLKVHLHGNHHNYTPRYVSRELLSKCPSLYGITSDINTDDWIKVILIQQRTWIYYDSEKITTLPQSSIADSYIKFTTAVSFPHSRGCTFFAERNPIGSAFINYPPEAALFVNDSAPLFVDEDVLAAPTPDLTTQTVVIGTTDITHGFQDTYGDEVENVLPDYIYWKHEYESTGIGERVSRLHDLVDIFDKSPYTNRKQTFMTLLNRISRNNGDPNRGAWISWTTHRIDNNSRKFILLSELILIYNYQSYNYDTPTYDINECISRLLIDLNTFSVDALPIPAFINSDEDEEEEEEEVIGPVSTRNSRAGVSSVLPKRIRDIILADVLSKGEECSITMEALTAENLAITTCFHFFDKEAIYTWIQGNDTCPQCRKRAALFT